MAVILDVVYNHLGPDGNYVGEFSRAYFSDRYKTDWGSAINFDGEQSGSVREFFLTNAAYWIREFHLDGLRLDATQNIYDDKPPNSHILTDIGRSARAAASNRTVILIAENEPQHPELCRSIDDGGYGLDAVWNDDFHHSATVALTGHNEGYYTDYTGSPQEFISAAKYGYLYQGQWYRWQKQLRGHAGLDISPAAFICFLQNHDQIANSGRGWRAHLLTSPARYRALLSLTLLMPATPLLFQGQEFAASSPFVFFADHKPELASMVQTGRAEFLAQFPRLEDAGMIAQFAPPHDRQTFERCKLDFSERTSHANEYRLTHDLLALRKSLLQRPPRACRTLDGAVIGPRSFLLRFFIETGADWMLVVNLGTDLNLSVLPEPLLAPPTDHHWQMLFSTEDPKYRGQGTRDFECKTGGWFLGAEMTMVLSAKPGSPPPDTMGADTK
jgi:maltooligosyltrehalose trehalohydrolase